MDQPHELITTHSTVAQFRDLDTLAHVNNAVYFSWMEEARVEFLMRWGFYENVSDIDFVLAHAEVDFKLPVFARQTVRTEVVATRVSEKSFDLKYRMFVEDRLVAEGLTVQVSYDLELAKSKPLDPKQRALLAEQAKVFSEAELVGDV